MLVKIISLDRTIFEGETEFIVVPAKGGQLTILPHHVPLICPLVRGKIRVKEEEKEKIFEIEEGILKVDKEGVKILITPHGI